MPTPDERKFLHALIHAGATYHALAAIESAVGSWREAWQNPNVLKNIGLSDQIKAKLETVNQISNPDALMRDLVRESVALITPSDPEYPESLKTIAQPPFALYIKGSLPKRVPYLAVVGTRKLTDYGREATRKIIRDLAAKTDLAIVSGLAFGIDAESHRVALDQNLKTVGVIGGGLDRASFYPLLHWALAEDSIRRGGAVISEYPPGMRPQKHHFIARNRIVAGITAGTLVIEAPEKSGALITANFALEQGREVFAVPSPLFSPNAVGVHRLIQDGAKLVQSADDIIEELGLPLRSRASAAPESAAHPASLTETVKDAILPLLEERRSVDELKRATNLETSAIIASLSLLELKGLIRPMGQAKYQRII